MIERIKRLLMAVALIASLPGLAWGNEAAWSMDGGEIRLLLDAELMSRIGLRLSDSAKIADKGEYQALRLEIGRQGSLEFLAPGAAFKKLLGGSLPISHLPLTWADGSLVNETLRLAPAPDPSPTFQLQDSAGRVWLLLDYGHFSVTGDRLEVLVMDVKPGPAMARAIGLDRVETMVIGTANLFSNVVHPESAAVSKGGCAVPNWPTQPGFDADVEMLDMNAVAQTAILNGRIAITPSARFGNAGTADLPWFSMFARPSTDPEFCFDQGDGTCEPYGTDQGGLLVFAMYRHVQGRLEQLGRSGVKHAFNSTNESCACDSGRIVWTGCEDLYGVSTNRDRDYLGPREEITASSVLWNHTGSIWDQNSDGICDSVEDPSWFGGVKCNTVEQDALDRRMHVALTDLTTPGARYFVESWYLARDDVNVFNSHGHREVEPNEVNPGTWTFLNAALPFVQGPVIDEFQALQATDAGFVADDIDTGEGHLRVTSAVTDLGGNQWQFEISLMNFDFDRAIDQFDIPLAGAVMVSGLAFFDGDANGANDWSMSSTGGVISFKAPDGTALTWGRLVSFRFVTDREPIPITATLRIDQAGSPSTVTVQTFTGLDALFSDGFE